ncbi:hypothetical protein L7F22_045305 [Adiantum nelumboides]|nr:hypothetical protein [Adiantum nelumboides]
MTQTVMSRRVRGLEGSSVSHETSHVEEEVHNAHYRRSLHGDVARQRSTYFRSNLLHVPCTRQVDNDTFQLPGGISSYDGTRDLQQQFQSVDGGSDRRQCTLLHLNLTRRYRRDRARERAGPPKFAQMYVYDTDHEVQNRINALEGLDVSTLQALSIMMQSCNPYANAFYNVGRLLRDTPNAKIRMTICENKSSSRQYLIPIGNKVAAIMPGQGDLRTSGQCDIVLHYQDGRLQRISNLHRSYMPLLYVLLFPRGEDGWHLKLPYADVDVPMDALTNRQCVSQREYYAYRLQVRLDTNTCLLRGGCFLQQFMVDVYCTIEDCRLSWVCNHQHTLRAELYAGLIDKAHSNEGDILGQSVGQRIVLLLSFTGGPRHMYQLYQDAIATVRAKGKPDLFITFTCNPNWLEVTQALLPGQVSIDRPDITARVFFQKHSSMMRHVLKQNLFGKVVGYMSVVEFQKRGLPHSHTLLVLDSICKPRTTSDYDRMVELLDKGRFPMLHDTIVTCNIHGPCKEFNQSAPCMANG